MWVMLIAKSEDFSSSGETQSYRKRADSGRELDISRCVQCGTRLFHHNLASRALVFIAAGTLDDPGWAVPTSHIWIEKASPGVAMEDDAIKVVGQPADRQISDGWPSPRCMAHETGHAAFARRPQGDAAGARASLGKEVIIELQTVGGGDHCGGPLRQRPGHQVAHRSYVIDMTERQGTARCGGEGAAAFPGAGNRGTGHRRTCADRGGRVFAPSFPRPGPPISP